VPDTVTPPVRVILPEPFAAMVVDEPPPTLALIAIAPLLVVERLVDPPVTVTPPDTVSAEALVIETVVLPPVTVPVSTVPSEVTVRVLVPSVIVWPEAV